MKQLLVFVYGTLRKNERNHHYLKNAKLVAEQARTKGVLRDSGNDFPVLINETSDYVYGEVYEINDDILIDLDQLEGNTGNPSDSHYLREERTVETDAGVMKAKTYFYPSDRKVDFPEVPFGDWRLKKLLDKGVPLYFAYGSCMDDERIDQVGKLNDFNTIGRGLLYHHELRFTLRVSDGGRADIVEDHEQAVEGIVYEITNEALAYLYEREGVYRGMYRPAVVDVEIDGEMVPMLTFIVKDKVDELAPPDHYHNEIVRGGTNHLSEDYLKKIDERVRQLREMAK
ncbi:gamma-glutamylcyclotransferase [Tenuibacillus multivorans]|uniref:Uncharacterized conserved protein YtfP, gamma-glutamylcyclotransferase (GGCT)/AIG2-like family n=1 Tax=Tenuibacillus multivorans TaxID=237069 RepID=A0A1G9YGC1_9BACI|nr:gamma-glutamylcyclotransferase family protein [Tenuibacillus multivorans]GEL78517.1 putative gamma-glutamylcyclotransferase YkqA [Tenuibacillus multivorans]SDN08268.1 Uncharacterized conserved protein YtfP, gamma-glutamylcyclotransferase (GGCT)/AIG2-like family [Tenuibacillus multivorans]